jgi:hypothetical protein
LSLRRPRARASNWRWPALYDLQVSALYALYDLARVDKEESEKTDLKFFPPALTPSSRLVIWLPTCSASSLTAVLLPPDPKPATLALEVTREGGRELNLDAAGVLQEAIRTPTRACQSSTSSKRLKGSRLSRTCGNDAERRGGPISSATRSDPRANGSEKEEGVERAKERTVPWKSWASCATMVSLDRSVSSDILPMSRPSISIVPESASRNRKNVRARVDFPDPVLPQIPTRSPAWTVKETSLRTGSS